MGIIVSQALIDRSEGMSEGWRANPGCANEHDIPTLSPIETNKKRVHKKMRSQDFVSTKARVQESNLL